MGSQCHVRLALWQSRATCGVTCLVSRGVGVAVRLVRGVRAVLHAVTEQGRGQAQAGAAGALGRYTRAGRRRAGVGGRVGGQDAAAGGWGRGEEG